MENKDNTYPLNIHKDEDNQGAKVDYGDLGSLSMDLLSHLESSDALLTSSDLINSHEMMFKKSLGSAGKFATQQTLFGGNVSAPHDRIETELKLADHQVKEMWNKADTKLEKLSVLAFQHTRLVSIHPFEDGNGRSCRVVLLHSLKNKMETQELKEWNKSEYINGLTEARNNLNLSPLVNVLKKAAGINIDVPDRITPDYNTYPSHDLPTSSFKVELEESKNGKNSYKEYDVTRQECKWLKGENNTKPMTLAKAFDTIDESFKSSGLINKVFNSKSAIDSKMKIIAPLLSPSKIIDARKALKNNDNQKALDYVKNRSLKKTLTQSKKL